MKRVVLLIGPTCTGKSTLEAKLNSLGVPSVTSYTTRTPRTGEVNGVHYHFMTEDQVEELAVRGEIVQRVKFAGNYYGSTKAALDKALAVSDIAVIVVEPTGLTQFKEYAERNPDIEIVSVYINNSLQTLVTRLVQRFKSDANADPAYYWRRMTDMLDQVHEWPLYTNDWTLYFAEMDDGSKIHTVDTAASMILATLGR